MDQIRLLLLLLLGSREVLVELLHLLIGLIELVLHYAYALNTVFCLFFKLLVIAANLIANEAHAL